MKNVFKLYELEIKKFIILITSIQFLIIFSYGLDVLDINIPLISGLITFVYLLFVPGLLIIRIINLENLNNIESLLYTVGLSISAVIFIGFFLNIISPIFNFLPFSTTSLIITFSIFTAVMISISYLKDNNSSSIGSINLKFSPIFFVFLLPFLSVFGTYLMNIYNQNIILMALMILIVLIVILVAYDKISDDYFPVIIFLIAITLLFHTWLTSTYMWGRDIHSELFFSKLVYYNLYWDKSISTNTNSMLVITIFAPIFSKISCLTLESVYKVIFPTIFALIPLGVFEVVKKQFDSKIAFLAAFFFISIAFYDITIISSKQLFAEFFIILSLLILIQKKSIKFSVLLIIFSVLVIVSHYGTSYIYILSLMITVVMIMAMNISRSNSIISKFRNRFFWHDHIKEVHVKFNNLTVNFVLLFIVIAIGWYLYGSSASIFDTFVNSGQHIYSSIFSELLDPNSAEGLKMISTNPLSLSGQIHKYLMLSTQFFIIFGILGVLLFGKKEQWNIRYEFIAFSLSGIIILIFSIIVPNFSNQIYTLRLYQITLLFLSPFCIIGGIHFFQIIGTFMKVSLLRNVKNPTKIVSLILIILFLFQIGFIGEIINDPSSIPLSKNSMVNSNINEKINFYYDYNVYEQDMYSAKWFSDKTYNENLTLYIDAITTNVINYDLFKKFNIESYSKITPTKNQVFSISNSFRFRPKSYLYLSYHTVVGQILITNKKLSSYNETQISQLMTKLFNTTEVNDKIYSNGGSDIYLTK